MKLIWHGHSCFTLISQDGILVFDPYKNHCVPGLELPDLKADIVLCSHNHDDHNAKELVKLSQNKATFQIQKIQTYHDDQFGKLRGKNIVHIVQTEDMKVVHMGDIGCDFDMKGIINCDVLLIPVGGFYTIDTKTALQFIQKIHPRIVIPMHYRSNDFGYDVLSTVDEFKTNVKTCVELDCNEIEISKETKPQVVILRCK